MVGATLVSLIAVALVALIETGRLALGLGAFIALGLVVLTVWYYFWLRWMAPQAIVTTPDYLAIRSQKGQRLFLPWAEIHQAKHKTGVGGMQWKLSIGSHKVVIRDIGIHPERWALLWHVIGATATEHDAEVRVDMLSASLFSD